MPYYVNKLKDQTVVILGGTGGVGMAVTEALIEFGANVIITSSRQEKLDNKLLNLLSRHPNNKPGAIVGFTCDLPSAADSSANIDKLVDQVKAHLSDKLGGASLNHFIYAAGDSLPTAPIEEITQEKFHAALQVRATSCILAIKAFLPLLPKTNKSSMTLTGGSICDKPIPGGWAMLAFLASGLNGLTRQLASDLAPIRVNSIAPGVVDTDLWSGMSKEQREGFYDSMAKQLPTGAVGQASDVAESFLYVMKDANITGSTIHTNAGAFL